MKNCFIIVLILSIMFCFGLSEKYEEKKDKIANNDYGKIKNKQKSFYNETKKIFLEENEKLTDLKRKSNGYWKVFLTIFILAFAFSGGFVYFYVLVNKFC